MVILNAQEFIGALGKVASAISGICQDLRQLASAQELGCCL